MVNGRRTVRPHQPLTINHQPSTMRRKGTMANYTKSEAREWAWENLRGQWTTIMTPFTPQDTLDEEGLRHNLCQIPNVVGVKEASFSQQTSIETHLMIGKQAIISTPDEWIFAKAKDLGFQQQVMFANTSDWRFDTPGANHYVQFIERATRGDL